MKYPFILFYRLDKYSEIDAYFDVNKDALNCTFTIINESKSLNKLFNSDNQLLITYGPEETEYHSLVCPFIAKRMGGRWVHFKAIESIADFNRAVNYCFVHNSSLIREQIRPIFSVFTTCFNSYNKVLRAYNSLLEQTHLDWEWVIIDDSTDEAHFEFLRENIQDERVRMYKRSKNSGNIGNVKNEAVSLCRGNYVLELDHDDEILPHVLFDSAVFFDNNPDTGFIYMDFANIYENGTNFSYGDFICKGYGGYYCQKHKGKWIYVYMTPNINNITLSHLVCCPNHPRIWRRSVLLNVGNYSELLPVCDDYEILLRTAVNTKMAKISKLGYIQYMNENNNNFSLIRNGEINRIGPNFIMPIFYQTFSVNEKMKQLSAYEDEKYIQDHSQIWKRNNETYEHCYANLIHNPNYDKQYCIIGTDALLKNLAFIKNEYENERNDFIFLDNCPIEELWSVLETNGIDKFKCYSLKDHSALQLENYFKLLYKSANNYEILVVPEDFISINEKKLEYNTSLANRYEVINSITSALDKYLEIGVEYGITFKLSHFTNKIGVDPDPKFEFEFENSASSIIKMTSDDFFICNDETFDVIFIDGMHQVEFFIKDINNSIGRLNENGKIIVDDILPASYREQLKVPNKHYYENGILKYGEPWTGDVWKVMYYILQNHSNDIEFSYFNNPSYRGIGVIQIKNNFQINLEKIDEINAYDYNSDFEKYTNLYKIKEE